MNPKLHELREKIFARLQDSSQETNPQRSETLLIRDDHFYGHRFQLGSIKAELVSDANRVKFYNATGRIVSDLSVHELDESTQRRAA